MLNTKYKIPARLRYDEVVAGGQNTKNGQAVISVTVFLLIMSLVIISSFSAIVLKETKNSQNFVFSKRSYFLAEAGVEDLSYRIIKGKNYSGQEVIDIDGYMATTNITVVGNERHVTAEGDVKKDIRKVEIVLTTDVGSSFFYGLQAGGGGLLMENSSSVRGNVYSNGSVVGENSNIIRGTVVSAGPSGLIDGVHATGTAYAHTITDSYIEEDAYYQSIDIPATTVLGDLYPGSPDQPLGGMPISDEKIEEWKAAAEAGGVINSPCPYIISSDTTIGPKKINCDLEISGSPTVTINGAIWVVGKITFKNSPIIRIDSSLGNMSVPIIADDPSNRSTGSTISFNQSATFYGSGDPNSYVLFVSQNNSAETGGSEVAISSNNSVQGKALVYAPHGEVTLYQSGSLKEITAYKIHLRNSATVIYETGLNSLLFQSGPGGAYTISQWKEI
ncbi:hypothetical protein KKG15_02730 [Patescibacteria group bacterium]|nr:hypothetical protein [Patescibacteria group bacterium]